MQRFKLLFDQTFEDWKLSGHGNKEGMVQVNAEIAKLGTVQEVGGTLGATLLFGCEVQGFSRKEEK